MRLSGKRLRKAVDAFVRAGTWAESRALLDQCPALLSDEADALLAHLVGTCRRGGDVQGTEAYAAHRELLRRCRVEGVDAAFAPLLAQENAGPAIEIPPGFEDDVQMAGELSAFAQAEPWFHAQRIALIEDMLGRLPSGEHPSFRAMLLNDLGNAYAFSPQGNRPANLERAIACYQEAADIWTADTAPLCYASLQNSIGCAYAYMATGDRAEHLRRAIAHFEAAQRHRTPEADPNGYAWTQHNLGEAYAQLPVAIERRTCAARSPAFETPCATARGIRSRSSTRRPSTTWATPGVPSPAATGPRTCDDLLPPTSVLCPSTPAMRRRSSGPGRRSAWGRRTQSCRPTIGRVTCSVLSWPMSKRWPSSPQKGSLPKRWRRGPAWA